MNHEELLERMPVLVWCADPLTLENTYVNQAAETILGFPHQQCIAPNSFWVEHVPEEDRSGLMECFSRAVHENGPFDLEHRVIRADGRMIWLRNIGYAVYQSGQPKELVGVGFDISRLKDSQEILNKTLAEIESLKSRIREQSPSADRFRIDNGSHGIVGKSSGIRQVLAQIDQVATTDATVLLLGETGTGKDALAVCIHESSTRRNRPLVSVNCAAIPGPLVESELFGRERGAFTGSLSRQVGRFELANESTLYLDEIGELSPEIQAKLLRVLESKHIERLGNPKPVAVNVRIIAATNRDLPKAVAEGRFRQDLYYRLNVFPITVPPLRDRLEDIPLLVWAFVDEFTKVFNKNIETIERDSLEALHRYHWPGNVRELKNLVERAMIVASGPRLRIELPILTPLNAPEGQRKLDQVEREHIVRILENLGWRVRGPNGAAAQLGLKPTTLEARMLKLGIRRPHTAN